MQLELLLAIATLALLSLLQMYYTYLLPVTDRGVQQRSWFWVPLVILEKLLLMVLEKLPQPHQEYLGREVTLKRPRVKL